MICVDHNGEPPSGSPSRPGGCSTKTRRTPLRTFGGRGRRPSRRPPELRCVGPAAPGGRRARRVRRCDRHMPPHLRSSVRRRKRLFDFLNGRGARKNCLPCGPASSGTAGTNASRFRTLQVWRRSSAAPSPLASSTSGWHSRTILGEVLDDSDDSRATAAGRHIATDRRAGCSRVLLAVDCRSSPRPRVEHAPRSRAWLGFSLPHCGCWSSTASGSEGQKQRGE